MNSIETNRNRVFWLLQFVGWGFISSLPIFILKEVGIEFIIYSIIVGLLISIVATSVLRWYLKSNVDFESFRFIDFVRIGVSFLLTSAAFGALNYFAGYLYAKFGPGLSDQHIQLFKMYDGFWVQTINALMLVGAWLVTYLVIKLLLKLNRDRIDRLELNSNLKQRSLTL